MILHDDRQLLEGLLDTNRELVAANRQIAESLANIERLYVEQLHRQQEAQQASAKMMDQLTGTNRWLVPALSVVPIVVSLIIFIFLALK